MTEDYSNIRGLKVLLGVSGGVAAYKAVDLASKLTANGAQVRCVMTQNACKLIGPKSFEAVTGNQVHTDLWSATEEYIIGHVRLVDWADVVVVAPATANIIGKMANGICDEILSTTLCTCWQKPLLVAPAMNTNMWDNPAVQRNLAALKDSQAKFIGPNPGRLACGIEAMGRMAEPIEILERIAHIASELRR